MGIIIPVDNTRQHVRRGEPNALAFSDNHDLDRPHRLRRRHFVNTLPSTDYIPDTKTGPKHKNPHHDKHFLNNYISCLLFIKTQAAYILNAKHL